MKTLFVLNAAHRPVIGNVANFRLIKKQRSGIILFEKHTLFELTTTLINLTANLSKCLNCSRDDVEKATPPAEHLFAVSFKLL